MDDESSDSTGLMPQLVGQLETISTKEKPLPSSWYWNAFFTAALAFLTLGTSAAVSAGNDRPGPASWLEDLAHVHEAQPCSVDVAAVGRSGGLHAEHGGRGHLAAGHAVDAVVDEDDGEVLAAVGSGHRLGQADSGEVAVALVGEHQRLRAAALEGAGDGAGPAMRGRDGVEIKIGNGQAAAADALHIAGVIDHAQLVERLGDYLADARVHAAGAEARDGALENSGGLGNILFPSFYSHASLSAAEAARGLDDGAAVEHLAAGGQGSDYLRPAAHGVLHVHSKLGGDGHLRADYAAQSAVIELVVGHLREGIDLLRADKAGLDALGTQDADGGLGNTAGDAVGGEDDLGVLGHVVLILHLAGLPALVELGVAAVHILLADAGVEAGAAHDLVLRSALFAGGGPGLGGADGGHFLRRLGLGQYHGLHHGAGEAVHEQQHGVGVLVRENRRLPRSCPRPPAEWRGTARAS